MDYYYSQDNTAIDNNFYNHQLYDGHDPNQLEQLINDKENSVNNVTLHADNENNENNDDNISGINDNNNNEDYLVPQELLELNAHEHDDFYLVDPFSNDYPLNASTYNVNNTSLIYHREDSRGPLENLDYFTIAPTATTKTSAAAAAAAAAAAVAVTTSTITTENKIDTTQLNNQTESKDDDTNKEKQSFQIYQDFKLNTLSSNRGSTSSNTTTKVSKRLTPSKSKSFSGSFLLTKRKSRSSVVSLSSTTYSTDDDELEDDLLMDGLTSKSSASSSISLSLPFLFPDYNSSKFKQTQKANNDINPFTTFKKTSSTNDITQTKLSCRLRRFSSFSGSTSPSNPFYRPLFNLKFGETNSASGNSNTTDSNSNLFSPEEVRAPSGTSSNE